MKTAIVLCLMMELAGCRDVKNGGYTNGSYVRDHGCAFIRHIAADPPENMVIDGKVVREEPPVIPAFSAYECRSPNVDVFVQDDDPNAPPVPKEPK